jgi:hypothetical protein
MAMADRFVIRTGDSFDVIEGVKLNTEPLDRADADRLAKGSPEPRRRTFPEGTISDAAPHEKGASQGPPLPAAQSAPMVAPAVDLRTTRADQAGGSAGFRIRGC